MEHTYERVHCTAEMYVEARTGPCAGAASGRDVLERSVDTEGSLHTELSQADCSIKVFFTRFTRLLAYTGEPHGIV
jgi:hypothetical protein